LSDTKVAGCCKGLPANTENGLTESAFGGYHAAKQIEMQKKESARLRALYSYEIIDSVKERDFDRLTELASLIAGCEISLISFIDKERVWYKSAKGLDVEEVPRGFTMCERTLNSNELFLVEDTLEDVFWSQHPMVQEGLKVRFYAGFPMIDPNGFTLGSFCVISSEPKKLSSSQYQMLSMLVEEAISAIVDRRKKQEYKQFSRLINNSNDLICILAPDLTFKMANPCFNRHFGWTGEELQFKTILDIVPAEDLEKARLLWSNIKNCLSEEHGVHQVSLKAGGYRVIEWTATNQEEDKNIFAIGRDVTAEIEKNKALKDSEQKLKALRLILQEQKHWVSPGPNCLTKRFLTLSPMHDTITYGITLKKSWRMAFPRATWWLNANLVRSVCGYIRMYCNKILMENPILWAMR
jgi:PAS domain S-box-containing protein